VLVVAAKAAEPVAVGLALDLVLEGGGEAHVSDGGVVTLASVGDERVGEVHEEVAVVLGAHAAAGVGVAAEEAANITVGVAGVL